MHCATRMEIPLQENKHWKLIIKCPLHATKRIGHEWCLNRRTTPFFYIILRYWYTIHIQFKLNASSVHIATENKSVFCSRFVIFTRKLYVLIGYAIVAGRNFLVHAIISSVLYLVTHSLWCNVCVFCCWRERPVFP